MRKVAKSSEPIELTNWKQRHPQLTKYLDLNNKTNSVALKAEGKLVIDAIRTQNVKDQYYLCAYCMCLIENRKDSAMNEHVEPRRFNHQKELDFGNIVASCTTKNQCDHSHGSQPLNLHCLMDECEEELEYGLNGKVLGTTDRAKETIKVLNLGDEQVNNRFLIDQRKQYIEMYILHEQGIEPDELKLESDDILEMMLDELTTLNNGNLAAYSPVISSIIQRLL